MTLIFLLLLLVWGKFTGVFVTFCCYFCYKKSVAEFLKNLPQADFDLTFKIL